LTEQDTEVQLSVDLVRAATGGESGFFAGVCETVVRDAERRYRQFVRLVQLHPSEPISPAKDIDEMWHLHMLHPVAYYGDCMTNFGELLDHDGGFGSASPEEWDELVAIFENTARLWRAEYNEEYGAAGGAVAKCVKRCAKCAVKCRTACKK
jgi:hypothetical protein